MSPRTRRCSGAPGCRALHGTGVRFSVGQRGHSPRDTSAVGPLPRGTGGCSVHGEGIPPPAPLPAGVSVPPAPPAGSWHIPGAGKRQEKPDQAGIMRAINAGHTEPSRAGCGGSGHRSERGGFKGNDVLFNIPAPSQPRCRALKIPICGLTKAGLCSRERRGAPGPSEFGFAAAAARAPRLFDLQM